MIPPVPKSLASGDPLAAKWLMDLRDAVNARTPLPSPGVRFRRTKGGFHTLIDRQPVSGDDATPHYGSCLTPRKFTVPRQLEDPVTVVFHPCELRACGITQQGTMHPVHYDESTLSDDPAPEIELSDEENEIWVSWTTDAYGDVDTDSVELTITEPTGCQTHIPPSPAGSGQTGKYKQLCAKIILEEPEEGDTERTSYPEWIPIDAGLSWEAFDRALVNTGSGAQVAKEITSNESQFRSLTSAGTEPSGTEVVDVWVKPEQKSDAVEFSGKVEIPAASGPSNWIKFVACDEVTELAKVEWDNGQITTNTNQTVIVGECGTDVSPPEE